VPDVEAASAQPAGSVTVATLPFTKSFAAGQLPPNPPKVTACPVARMKLGLNTTLIVLEAAKAPDGEDVRPTVQVEAAFAAAEPGEKVAVVGEEPYAAPTENVAISPPSAAAAKAEPATRFKRECSRYVGLFVAR